MKMKNSFKDRSYYFKKLYSMLDEEFFGGVNIDEMLKKSAKILNNKKILLDKVFEKLVMSNKVDTEDLVNYLINKYYNIDDNMNEDFNYKDDQFSEEQLDAINLLSGIGLELISSPAQIKHGTLMFKDTQLEDVYYSITKSGYARRHLKGEVYSPWARKHIPQNAMYQLNKKRPESMYTPGDYSQRSRITLPGDYYNLSHQIYRVVRGYRKNNQNENKQENTMRAKTINEDIYPDWVSDESKPSKDFIDSQSDAELIKQLENILQNLANIGVEYETIEDIVASAMNNIDWAYAESQNNDIDESLNEDIFSHPDAWTYKPGDEVRFYMKDVSPTDFGDEDEGELAASHDKMKAIITAQATATATMDELGDKNYEYYDIEFGDGIEMPGVSGYHLEPTYKKKKQTISNVGGLGYSDDQAFKRKWGGM